jgi:hypothetical protein
VRCRGYLDIGGGFFQLFEHHVRIILVRAVKFLVRVEEILFLEVFLTDLNFLSRKDVPLRQGLPMGMGEPY